MWENGSIAPLIPNFDNRRCGTTSECDREVRWRQITHHRIAHVCVRCKFLIKFPVLCKEPNSEYQKADLRLFLIVAGCTSVIYDRAVDKKCNRFSMCDFKLCA